MNDDTAKSQEDKTDNVAEQAAAPVGANQSFLSKILERFAPSEEPEVVEWQDDTEHSYIEQEPVKTRTLLYAILISLIAVVFWASIAEVNEVTRGEAKVIPSQQIQVVQSLDGGVLTEILTREGQIVDAGELLFRLDETRFASSFREQEIEFFALQIKAARLQAVAEIEAFEVNDSLREQLPDVYQQELILYENSIEELDNQKLIAEQQLLQRQKELREVKAKIAQMEESFTLASQELTMTRPLVASGAVSEVELLRLERETNNLKGELNQANAQLERISAAIDEADRKVRDVVLSFRNQRREELTGVTSKINSLRESTLGLSDRVKQTAIRSPVKGTVNRLYFNTIGGVVLPGKEVVEIVPLDDTLLLEARIRPQDIAFLTPGQAAVVKFTAYDFVIHGGLDAEVEHIGADTLMDEDGNPYYNVRVRTEKSDLGEGKPIIPGMVAEVDILTGSKTILAYLAKPVLRAKQYALTER